VEHGEEKVRGNRWVFGGIPVSKDRIKRGKKKGREGGGEKKTQRVVVLRRHLVWYNYGKRGKPKGGGEIHRQERD